MEDTGFDERKFDFSRGCNLSERIVSRKNLKLKFEFSFI